MAVTMNTILAVAPELSSETPDVINFFIAMARRRVSEQVWGNYTDDGVTFLTAHLLTMKNRAGTPGAPTTLKVGDLQAQYAAVTSSSDALSSTSYGVEYLELRKLVVVTASSV